MNTTAFETEYKKLNPLQKEAVDTIDGPVMVVAGPGTGKTQILSLRIGNILLKTEVKADSILCLTFTNSAVKAMRERLRAYIGSEAGKVHISTFHSFGLEILEKFYEVLGLQEAPKLMDEKDTIVLFDEILEQNDWTYIRPRSDSARYFRDLKSLISLLKRERVTPENFGKEIEKEIKYIKTDKESISTRGESKGKLKKDAEKKIEGLGRTLEAMKFYELYEEEKKKRNLFDYDDILESLNRIVDESEDAKSYIQENFLYVLIDEHQDSSGVQNVFLEKVWGDVEKPDIFVVGDDRQLIYGFGGASLEYFKHFENAFGKAKLITLLENYRSTQRILDSSHDLLESALSKGKLKSQSKDDHPIRLVEAYYPRDEIIAAGLEIKERIEKGENPNDMAILVPKNRQVRSALTILKEMGIPVSGGDMVSLFETQAALSLIRVLKVMANPADSVPLAASFFDKYSLIPPLKAHTFIRSQNMREFSLITLEAERNNLFDAANEVNIWINKLKSWLEHSNEPLYFFLQKVGTEYLLDSALNHEDLIQRIEVVRTMLHLALMQGEKNPQITLADFLNFLDRLQNYGEDVPIAVFSADDGVKVLTLHGSKGLEFDYVWIAHMDERSFASGRISGFSLPESIKQRIEEKDEEVLKRQLYVAITRAKRFCSISYSLKSFAGGAQELAHIIADLSGNFEKRNAEDTEKIILKNNPKAYIAGGEKRKADEFGVKELVKAVKKDYQNRTVSVSLLNNFFECTWKWYFRNLLQLPEPKTESLEFGNIIHGSIDAVLKLDKKPTNKDLDAAVTTQVHRSQFGNARKQEELKKLALTVVSNWVDARFSDIAKKRENEKSVSVKDERFPHLSIYGKIDLIEKLDEDTIRVTDFKTGNGRKKSEIEKIDEEGRMGGYMRQLAMYSYLIKQSPSWKVDVQESRLEFVEAKNSDEAFYNTTITDEQIDLLIKDIKDYERLIQSGEWIDRPCQYNSYGKNSECPYCIMGEIYK